MNSLRPGSDDPMVKYLQRYLKIIGYNVQETGVYYPAMEKDLRDFQKSKGLTVDGIAGSKTFTSLMKVFKGLTDEDVSNMADELQVEKATIEAIYTVESGGFGFLPDGNPKILFEGHVFYKQLIKKDFDIDELLEQYPTLIYKSWTREFYLRGMEEWMRLGLARTIDEEAALMSASFGTFQIMGINYKLCGYSSVDAFFDNQYKKEVDHLRDLANFVKNRGLLEHLQKRDWDKFAYGYNGPSYKTNKYDQKLAEAFAQFSARG